MKRYLLNSALLIILTISLTGCYTVIWDPSENNFPTKDNASDENGFYPATFYGDYADFYGSPWWYDITPPNFTDNNNRINAGTVIRNLGGRGVRTSRSSVWNFITTDPAATNSTTQRNTLSRNSTTTNNNTNTSTSTRTETTRSSQSSTNSRNDSGSRNTDTRRKR